MIKCRYCGKELETLADIERHMMEKHPEKVVCTIYGSKQTITKEKQE